MQPPRPGASPPFDRRAGIVFRKRVRGGIRAGQMFDFGASAAAVERGPEREALTPKPDANRTASE